MFDEKAYKAEYYKKNRDKYTAVAKSRYAMNRDELLQKRAQQRLNESHEKREQRLIYLKQYRLKPDRVVKAKELQQSDTYKYTQYQKQSALRRKKIFDLTFEQFVELYHAPCYLCGSLESHGIDRVDNAVGYTFENAKSCCALCNKLKWAHNKDTFLSHILKIAKHNNMV